MADDAELHHALKNHMAIILGYADLLLDDLPKGHPHRGDVEEIRKAALAATALFSTGTDTLTT
jgi:hypothetical protein